MNSEQTFSFLIERESTECRARVGRIQTRRGEIPTPIFMPVGTQGTVKTLSPADLREIGAAIILANTYHLYLRPGTEVLDHFGGIHHMMRWDRPMLTDSGGFQVFSLKTLNKITDEGVTFASHLDGSKHLLSPERSMAIQRSIGAEIMMCFDECCPWPCSAELAREAMERSIRWAGRCRTDHPAMRNGQALFGIVQGSTDLELRRESLERTAEIGFEGLAIGGLSVGEPKDEMLKVMDDLIPRMPRHLPRYLMGVGTPEDLIWGVERGIDMFDCVLPTRVARHGAAFTRAGRIDLTALKHRLSDEPIEASCTCYACRQFSRGYLRHLYKAGEMLAPRLVSLHNLAFLLETMRQIRDALREGRFRQFREEFFRTYPVKEGSIACPT